jgi:hypothetical protein
MPRRPPLPPELSVAPFTFGEALSRGVSAHRLRAGDLDKPFHGVRSVGLDLALLENRCLAYATRMLDTAVFSHVTAAVLWGMPLPRAVSTEALHVTVPAGHRAPRGSGVVGHARARTGVPALVRGLVVTSPADAWADLAEMLPVHDLVAAGEFAVTGNPIRDRPPITSIDELRGVTRRRRGSPGSRAREQALTLIEVGALSRPETLTRLLLVGAGLPHPLINSSIYDSNGGFVAMPDLSWPEYRVALEYEGDDHRSVKRFRADIGRIERLVDHDWVVVKATANDLFDTPRELVERMIRRLSIRGWVPGRIRLPQNAIYAR